MLKLAVATGPRWGAWAAARAPEILRDHAHLERKAAGTALRLLFRYPDRPSLQRPLADLAREELAHFTAVAAHLERLGLELGRQRAAPYAGRVHAAVRGREPERLLDLLLCAAAIEARSCERLGLLADAWEDAALGALYRELLAAEARHHRLYVELACGLFPAADVDVRLGELLAHEARVIAAAPSALARLHAGPLT